MDDLGWNTIDQQIPVSLLTGFLGSGKTTVLNHLLRQPGLHRTAVVVNEFGEIGLDHELVTSADEDLVLLQSGCLCCTIRGDLARSLQELLQQRDAGRVPCFDRVIIETTGLADPAPILHTLMTDEVLEARFRLDGVVSTVDAATGSRTLDRQIEALKQAAVADRILLTKTDLATDDELEALHARLRHLNPAAPIIDVVDGVVDPATILDTGPYDPATKSLDVQGWLRAEAYDDLQGRDHHHAHPHHDHRHAVAHDPRHPHQHVHDPNRHDARIRSVSFVVDEPIPPPVFGSWLSALTMVMGPDILRLKALVHVEGLPGPLVLHGVQHLFHAPVQLAGWPSDDHRSRIVLIGRDLSQRFLEDGLAFLRGHSP